MVKDGVGQNDSKSCDSVQFHPAEYWGAKRGILPDTLCNVNVSYGVWKWILKERDMKAGPPDQGTLDRHCDFPRSDRGAPLCNADDRTRSINRGLSPLFRAWSCYAPRARRLQAGVGQGCGRSSQRKRLGFSDPATRSLSQHRYHQKAANVASDSARYVRAFRHRSLSVCVLEGDKRGSFGDLRKFPQV